MVRLQTAPTGLGTAKLTLMVRFVTAPVSSNAVGAVCNRTLCVNLRKMNLFYEHFSISTVIGTVLYLVPSGRYVYSPSYWSISLAPSERNVYRETLYTYRPYGTKEVMVALFL